MVSAHLSRPLRRGHRQSNSIPLNCTCTAASAVGVAVAAAGGRSTRTISAAPPATRAVSAEGPTAGPHVGSHCGVPRRGPGSHGGVPRRGPTVGSHEAHLRAEGSLDYKARASFQEKDGNRIGKQGTDGSRKS